MSRYRYVTMAKSGPNRICTLINSGEITGERGLAAAVIGVAVKDGDEDFFRTDDGQFWADLAELDLPGLQRMIPDVGKG